MSARPYTAAGFTVIACQELRTNIYYRTRLRIYNLVHSQIYMRWETIQEFSIGFYMPAADMKLLSGPKLNSAIA
jgi:hypothetical protein